MMKPRKRSAHVSVTARLPLDLAAPWPVAELGVNMEVVAQLLRAGRVPIEERRARIVAAALLELAIALSAKHSRLKSPARAAEYADLICTVSQWADKQAILTAIERCGLAAKDYEKVRVALARIRADRRAVLVQKRTAKRTRKPSNRR